MDSRKEKALENHKKKYNCCQAVACAFSDLVGVDEETMFKLAEGFGLGMGGMEGTCGAVSGAVLIAGLKNSTGNLQAPNSKADTYRLSREITQEFLNKNKSITCRELKGVETKVPLRSCDGCIEDAAAIAERILFAKTANQK